VLRTRNKIAIKVKKPVPNDIEVMQLRVKKVEANANRHKAVWVKFAGQSYAFNFGSFSLTWAAC